MNTDTPRTNDAAFMAIYIDGDGVPTEFARQLERELAAVTDQRDRLAAVLQRIRDGYGGQVASPNCCADCDYLLPIDEALQSLTLNKP
jgi:hypothetical protein